MSTVAVTLVSKPGCHLCDAAREVVTGVLGALPASAGGAVTLDEVSIFDDEELLEKYVEEIPVVLINGKVHNIWRVDPDRFRIALDTALLEATA